MRLRIVCVCVRRNAAFLCGRPPASLQAYCVPRGGKVTLNGVPNAPPIDIQSAFVTGTSKRHKIPTTGNQSTHGLSYTGGSQIQEFPLLANRFVKTISYLFSSFYRFVLHRMVMLTGW